MTVETLTRSPEFWSIWCCLEANCGRGQKSENCGNSPMSFLGDIYMWFHCGNDEIHPMRFMSEITDLIEFATVLDFALFLIAFYPEEVALEFPVLWQMIPSPLRDPENWNLFQDGAVSVFTAYISPEGELMEAQQEILDRWVLTFTLLGPSQPTMIAAGATSLDLAPMTTQVYGSRT